MPLACSAPHIIHFYSGGCLDYSVLFSAMCFASRRGTP